MGLCHVVRDSASVPVTVKILELSINESRLVMTCDVPLTALQASF